MIISVNKNLTSAQSKDDNLKKSAGGWEPLDVDFLQPIDSSFFKVGLYFAEFFDYEQNRSHSNTDFSSIAALVLDFDAKHDQLSSTKASELVKKFTFRAFIVSGPSYSTARDSYRIIIPMKAPITGVEFVNIMNLFSAHPVFGKGLDESCTAMRFWSPSTGALFFTNGAKELAELTDLITILSGKQGAKKLKENYDKIVAKAIEQDVAQEDKVHDIFNDHSKITVGAKVTVVCPFCDPKNRRNANAKNAFISKTKSNRLFLFCSSENKTFWKDIDYNALLKPFISYSDTVYKLGFDQTANRISISKIGRDKFHVFTNTMDKVESQKAWKALIDKRHFEVLPTIEYRYSAAYEQTKFYMDSTPIYAEIAPEVESVKDNDFIESYLDSTFKEYSEFIKDWLAIYSYTNFRKLPTLIFIGGRSTGKTTFSNMVAHIFPGCAALVNSVEKNFTGFYENKLLVIDESLERGKNQYALIKMLSGTDMLEINKKFKDVFYIKNNLNIIVTSNNEFPIFVETNELATSEKKNQFFLCEFPELDENVLDASINEKLSDRIIHWLKTEGLRRFKILEPDMDNYRYSLPTPITPALKLLFEASVSPMTFKAYECLSAWEENQTKVDDTHIDNDFIKTWAKVERTEPTWLLKEMRKLKLIGESKSKRWNGKFIKMHKVTRKV